MTTFNLAAPTGAVAPIRAWLPGFLALAVVWGSSFLFIKVALEELHPLYITLARVGVGAATLLVVLAVSRDRLPRDLWLWGHLSVVALLGVALPFTLFGYGEQRISSTLAGIWNATTPLVVLPLAVLVFRTERLTKRRATGFLLGFLGVVVILGVWTGVGGAHLTGQLMCLGAALCYGVAIPYQKRFISGHAQSGVSLSAVQLIVASAVLAVVAPLVAGTPPALGDLSLDVVGSVLALGALGTGIAFVVNMRNIRLAGASTASMVTYLIPLVATLVGVLVLGESLEWYQPVGATIVLVGVAVSQGVGRRRRAEVDLGPPDASASISEPRPAPPGSAAASSSGTGRSPATPRSPVSTTARAPRR